ncbi:MAG: hypothetical protein JO299_06495, partial [Gammaproteobacteria bacterium]|nr:hypothetical protein [Gammaproteobacteria bacterium]
MKTLLCIGLASTVILSANSSGGGTDARLTADSNKVSAVEYLYADVSDANTILAAIDSGLLSTYGGKDRGGWEPVYTEKRGQLTRELESLPTSGLSDSDSR